MMMIMKMKVFRSLPCKQILVSETSKDLVSPRIHGPSPVYLPTNLPNKHQPFPTDRQIFAIHSPMGIGHGVW